MTRSIRPPCDPHDPLPGAGPNCPGPVFPDRTDPVLRHRIAKQLFAGPVPEKAPVGADPEEHERDLRRGLEQTCSDRHRTDPRSTRWKPPSEDVKRNRPELVPHQRAGCPAADERSSNSREIQRDPGELAPPALPPPSDRFRASTARLPWQSRFRRSGSRGRRLPAGDSAPPNPVIDESIAVEARDPLAGAEPRKPRESCTIRLTELFLSPSAVE